MRYECEMSEVTFFILFIISNLNHVLAQTSPLSDVRFCGYQHTDDYGYEGNNTAIDEFPWLALIIYEKDPDVEASYSLTEIGCAGTLISERYVITTPICIRFRTDFAAAVRLGEHNVKLESDCDKFKGIKECTEPLLDIPIEKAIRHPDYQYAPYAKHAIALFRLTKRVTYTDFIRPICLPIPKLKVATVGDPLTSTGFGRIKAQGENTVIKKRIDSAMISIEECITQFYGKNPNSNPSLMRSHTLVNDTINDNNICTNDVEGTAYFTCEGDMGAPVMYVSKRRQWHLEGLVSFGAPTCATGVPAVHTKVRAYMDWIAENIKD